MCYQWQVKREEVTEEEWQQILEIRGEDLKTWRFSIGILLFTILAMILM